MQSWIPQDMFFEVSVSLGLVTPTPSLDLNLGSLRLESNSRYCNDVTKTHRCCKHVAIFGKNRLFVCFFNHSDVMALFKFAIGHTIIKPWEFLCMAIQKLGHRIKCLRNYRPVLSIFKRLAFHIFKKNLVSCAVCPQLDIFLASGHRSE